MDYKPPTTREEFDKMLAQHDWYYNFSDDHGVWTRGETQRARIQQVLVDHPEWKDTHDGWINRMFSKEKGFSS